jgi:tetratricopeptide (TPR) repeat protein
LTVAGRSGTVRLPDPRDRSSSTNPSSLEGRPRTLNRDELARTASALEAELAAQGSPRIFAPLAEIYRLQGRTDEAVRVAREGLRLFPEHLAIRIVLARALVDARDASGARGTYGEVLLRDPSNLEARAHLETRGEPIPRPSAGAPVTLAEPAAEDPMAGGPLHAEANAEPATGVQDLAEELGHLADLFSPRIGTWAPTEEVVTGIATLTLAEIYARQGLFDKAVEVCQTILARTPADQEAMERLRRYQEQLASVT